MTQSDPPRERSAPNAVYANSNGTRDLAQIVTETAWPQGYTTRLEGSYQAQEEATLRIGIFSLVSLAMIFIVLAGAGRRWFASVTGRDSSYKE